MRRVVRKTTSTSSSSKARRLEGGSEGNLPPYFTDTHRNPSTSNVTAHPHPSCTLEKTSIEEKIKKILLSTALQELPTRTKMKHHTLVGKESKNIFSHWCFIYLSFTVAGHISMFSSEPYNKILMISHRCSSCKSQSFADKGAPCNLPVQIPFLLPSNQRVPYFQAAARSTTNETVSTLLERSPPYFLPFLCPSPQIILFRHCNGWMISTGYCFFTLSFLFWFYIHCSYHISLFYSCYYIISYYQKYKLAELGDLL